MGEAKWPIKKSSRAVRAFVRWWDEATEMERAGFVADTMIPWARSAGEHEQASWLESDRRIRLWRSGVRDEEAYRRATLPRAPTRS
jgi:hypothetical protein